MIQERFKTTFARDIFHGKYAQGPNDTWDALVERLVEDVCGTRWGTQPALMSASDQRDLGEAIKQFKFVPGGRYLYYAGRTAKFYNNCFLGKAEEDSREEWAKLMWWATRCLMIGGGIGIDYTALRASGKSLNRTGGTASGPLPLMYAINELGRNVMQGGSRRSAIYASLNWQHEDIPLFLKAKNWHDQVWTGRKTNGWLKEKNFNFPAPLDMTNISVNWDDAWKFDPENPVFLENCLQAMKTGEPGFSFNFGDKQRETLRNALTSTSALN